MYLRVLDVRSGILVLRKSFYMLWEVSPFYFGELQVLPFLYYAKTEYFSILLYLDSEDIKGRRNPRDEPVQPPHFRSENVDFSANSFSLVIFIFWTSIYI